MRLNKYIASAGVCSRRKADELIANGNVKINGAVVREMGAQVEEGDVVSVTPQNDVIAEGVDDVDDEPQPEKSDEKEQGLDVPERRPVDVRDVRLPDHDAEPDESDDEENKAIAKFHDQSSVVSV